MGHHSTQHTPTPPPPTPLHSTGCTAYNSAPPSLAHTPGMRGPRVLCPHCVCSARAAVSRPPSGTKHPDTHPPALCAPARTPPHPGTPPTSLLHHTSAPSVPESPPHCLHPVIGCQGGGWATIALNTLPPHPHPLPCTPQAAQPTTVHHQAWPTPQACVGLVCCAPIACAVPGQLCPGHQVAPSTLTPTPQPCVPLHALPLTLAPPPPHSCITQVLHQCLSHHHTACTQ